MSLGSEVLLTTLKIYLVVMIKNKVFTKNKKLKIIRGSYCEAHAILLLGTFISAVNIFKKHTVFEKPTKTGSSRENFQENPTINRAKWS